MSDIVLGAATQQNLLALQNIGTQLDTTQNALATGLAVASPTDNAVAYFQAQSLTNRADDLSTRKDAIDQGISSLTAATNGINERHLDPAADGGRRERRRDPDRYAASSRCATVRHPGPAAQHAVGRFELSGPQPGQFDDHEPDAAIQPGLGLDLEDRRARICCSASSSPAAKWPPKARSRRPS